MFRGDEDDSPGQITPRIVQGILDATLVVADLTGENPNVYYELAIAHAFARPVLHIGDSDTRPKFDTKDSRVIVVELRIDQATAAIQQITRYAKYALDHAEAADNPVAQAAQRAQLQTVQDPEADALRQILDRLDTLDRRSRAERALDRHDSLRRATTRPDTSKTATGESLGGPETGPVLASSLIDWVQAVRHAGAHIEDLDGLAIDEPRQLDSLRGELRGIEEIALRFRDRAQSPKNTVPAWLLANALSWWTRATELYPEINWPEPPAH